MSEEIRQIGIYEFLELLPENQENVIMNKVLLRHSNLMIYEFADRLDFAEPTSFIRYFKREVGMTPLEYKKEE